MASVKICSIKGCGKRAKARGWCPAHYRRWLRHGGPTRGAARRDGAGKRWLYEHATFRGKKCLIWPFARLKSGYPYVRMNGYGSAEVASRVMCEIVNGPPPEKWYEAAHSCGNGHGGCCNPMHLKWKTPSDNRMDKRRHGTAVRKSQQKLTENQVRKIRSLKGLVPQSRLCAKYGVSSGLISKIQNGHEWAWLK